MCGIIGVHGHNAHNIVKQELDFLKRRGPDNQSVYNCGNGLVLGSTRLAMTDPHPRSNQPFKNNLNNDVVLLNGEIYNFKNLRKNLEKNNLIFTTESDTEVAVKSLGYLGVECVSGFEGMFAIAFFNAKQNTVTLIRDFLGKKPLYFHLSKSLFMFSSQIDTIQRNLRASNLNSSTLYTYLRLGYTIDPFTMYQEIEAIKPGEIIVIDLVTLSIKSRTIYVPSAFLEEPDISIRKSIKRAVDKRIEGHEKFAISLSGGVDSSIIALNVTDRKDDCTAYSMRWLTADKKRYNLDSIGAKKVADSLNMKFKFVDMPSANKIPDVLDEFINAMHEPNANPSALSMMILYKKISEDNHRLVLTGDGSDEIFGGYARYNQVKKFQYFPQIDSKLLNIVSDNFFRRSNFLSKFATSLIPVEQNDFWLYWHQICSNRNLRKLLGFSENLDLKINDEVNFFYLNNLKNKRIAKLMQMDLFFWLTMESNKKLDRISMWYSTEARSPFQDEVVISSAINSMKVLNYQVLDKFLLKNIYPELNEFRIESQGKLGFISPLGYWLRNNPDLIMDSINYLVKNFNFSRRKLLELSKAPKQGNYFDFNLLWSLIVLSRWHSLKF